MDASPWEVCFVVGKFETGEVREKLFLLIHGHVNGRSTKSRIPFSLGGICINIYIYPRKVMLILRRFV